MAELVNIAEIMSIMPHRYPFLLIDRVKDIKAGESCTGIKNVTIDEPFFQGHFPDSPVMPGVLIIEAMAQTSALLIYESFFKDTKDKGVLLMSIEGAKFRKPVIPGDQMLLYVKKEHNHSNVWKFKAEARVDDKLVAEATFCAMITDKKKGQ